jgi:hypothetical protein
MDVLFGFPVAELLSGRMHWYGKLTRLEYLKLLVATMVATPEEQAEYAALARPEVERYWQQCLDRAEKKRLRELEQLEVEITEREKNVLLLHQVGAYEHAVKTEAVIDRMRSLRGSPDGYKGHVMTNMNFRGFPPGDGGDLIYNLKYCVRQGAK